eukprot:gnl/MRDRNA2_/MRDRNA2_172094_c0_seq1.p1 gnl/MRDRNA2_/MRDRNA2_172094_c0~~gnl/MRDRNA2_/MRDRNA2_172094_c0_seq1.p1  ORF type:complete len:144 (-),score=47.63 gnl/MRDRNA2_/MRDRNA2_172094_c0_seq1:90-521(-)
MSRNYGGAELELRCDRFVKEFKGMTRLAAEDEGMQILLDLDNYKVRTTSERRWLHALINQIKKLLGEIKKKNEEDHVNKKAKLKAKDQKKEKKQKKKVEKTIKNKETKKKEKKIPMKGEKKTECAPPVIEKTSCQTSSESELN